MLRCRPASRHHGAIPYLPAQGMRFLLLGPKFRGRAGEMDVDLGFMVVVLHVMQVSGDAGQEFMLRICSKNPTFLALTGVRYMVGANLTFGAENSAYA